MNKNKLENLEYRGGAALETIPCPLCRGLDFKTLVVEQTLPVVRCAGCALVFVNPRPNRDGLLQFYENYFPMESAPLWQKQMADVFLKEGLNRIREFKGSGVLKLNAKPKLLDVGCGMGFFLDLMRQAGWDTKGIEPAPEAARHAREKLKLDLYEGTIEEAVLSDSFDAVTLWYVLEHVPNPHEILDRVARLLKPGGLLIIRVPNQNVTIDRILNFLGFQKFFLINPPRHLFDYSPKTLSRFLDQRGFRILSIRNGIPRATGTWLELLRRYAWYGIFELLYHLTGGRLLRGSSLTLYALKQ